jgi:hypothetical protein
MKKISLKSFEDYLKHVNDIHELGKNVVLFRGQSTKNPLLPSIARKTHKMTQLHLKLK